MRFSRFPVFAFAAFAFAGLATAQTAASAAAHADDNKPALEAIPAAEQEAMDAVRDYFLSNEEAVAQYDFDGYRVEFPQWWFNIRPSNTEPYLRFLCEASTAELLDEKVSKVREIVEGLM
jgi:phosphomannomutase